ncbi:MAG TPA: hypothetical protein VFW76_13715 [Ktedonobacterales bacterium]|nr:hypothetical protein [Ktedonobacterales bacterium]
MGYLIPQRDPCASAALAGFLCGLASCAASLFAAAIFALSLLTTFMGRGQGPGPSLSVLLLLLIAACPVALVGLILSIAGWRSVSRHGRARAGAILSFIALLPFILAIVIVIVSWSRCAPGCI